MTKENQTVDHSTSDFMPKANKTKFFVVCLLSPLIALTAWFWLIWLCCKES